MAIEFLQYPASCSFAQSPIIFAVSESNQTLYTSSSFQFVGELNYWIGNENESGSTTDFTFTKYPNENLVGIFDVSRVINSLFQTEVEDNSSQLYWFNLDFYPQYKEGNTFVTGSHVMSGNYRAIDGYGIFGEPISQSIEDSSPFFPILTNGPSTQTVFDTNIGRMSVFTTDGAGDVPTKIVYSGSNGQIEDFTLTESQNTSGSISQFPIGIGETDFPVSSSVEWYDISAFSGSTEISEKIRFNVECKKKYPNVRIKWKNRFGAFDYFNFSLVSSERFSTDVQTFEKQIGTWNGTALTYNTWDSVNKNYIADSSQTITVNSDYISEDYNEIFKELLLSEEIYWEYNESKGLLRPLTILTSDIDFLTGVNDKLIQYSFQFLYGQPFKLIL